MNKAQVTPNKRPSQFAPAKDTTTPAQVVNTSAPVPQVLTASGEIATYGTLYARMGTQNAGSVPANHPARLDWQAYRIVESANAGEPVPDSVLFPAIERLRANKVPVRDIALARYNTHLAGVPPALLTESERQAKEARLASIVPASDKTPAHAGSKLPAPVAQTTDKPVSKKEKTMNKQTASNTPAQVVITPAQQIAALQAQLAALQAAATPAPVIEIPVLAQVDNTRATIDAAYAQIDKLQNQFTKQHARGEIEYARRTSRKIAELFGKIDALSNTPAQNKTTPTQVVISSAPVVVNKQFPGKLGITNAIKAGATPVVMRTLRATGHAVCVPLTAERNPAEFDVFVLMGAEWDTMRMTSKAYVDDTQAWDRDVPVPVAPVQLGNKPIVLVTMRRHAWDALAGKAAHVKTAPKAAKALKKAAAKKPTVKAPKLVKPLTDHAALSLNERVDAQDAKLDAIIALLGKRK